MRRHCLVSHSRVPIAAPRTRSALAALLPAVLPAVLPAQRPAQRPAPLPAQSRFGGALAGVASQPLGEFRQNAKWGFGVDGAVTLAVDRRGVLSLRGEASTVGYSAGRSEFVAATNFGQVLLEQKATNRISTLSVGPQVTAPAGPVRPYVAATVGLTHFSTATAISVPREQTSTGQPYTLDERTNFSHTGRTVGVVAGVLVPLSALGLDLGAATLDVGVRYQRNARARFVRPGDVRLNETTAPSITTSEGEANVLSYRVGVAVRFD